MSEKTVKAKRGDAKSVACQEFVDLLNEINLPPFTKSDCVSLLMGCGYSRRDAELLADFCEATAKHLADQTLADLGI